MACSSGKRLAAPSARGIKISASPAIDGVHSRDKNDTACGPAWPPPPHLTHTCALLPQLPALAGGFAAAYGMWTILTRNSDKKVPHTTHNKEWAEATQTIYDAAPRQGSEQPVVSLV